LRDAVVYEVSPKKVFMSSGDMKVCSRCGTAKPLEDFWTDARKPGGREYTCKACRSLRRAQKQGRIQNSHTDSIWLSELLPLLARRLCARLYDEDVPALPAAYQGAELISPTAWHTVLRLLCQGVRLRSALRQAGASEGIFREYLRYEPRLKAWFDRTKQASKRRGWPSLLEVEEILRALIYSPGLSARGACRQHGVSYAKFLKASKLPEWEGRYLRVKALQRDRSFETMRTELMALGDGVTRTTRRNMAQRVHALKKLEPRRFWARKPPNAAAAVLRDARRRAKDARSKT
jgi:hypothetical protein